MEGWRYIGRLLPCGDLTECHPHTVVLRGFRLRERVRLEKSAIVTLRGSQNQSARACVSLKVRDKTVMLILPSSKPRYDFRYTYGEVNGSYPVYERSTSNHAIQNGESPRNFVRGNIDISGLICFGTVVLLPHRCITNDDEVCSSTYLGIVFAL